MIAVERGTTRVAVDRPERRAALPFEPADVIDHPSGYLALSSKDARFVAPDLGGFVAYREQGRHLIAFGGVHAPDRHRAALLDRFLAFATAAGRRVVAVQVREDQVQLFTGRGFTVNQLGTSFALTLRQFSLRGTARMRLRNKLQRARHAGVRVIEVGRDVPRDDGVFAELAAISAEWLTAKARPELQFMVGEIGGPEDTSRRIFLAVDGEDRALGFITYVPAWGARPGWLHDLTRRRPGIPPGVMELVNVTAIQRMQAEGAPFLHFGFTPFIVDGPEPESASRIAAWVVGTLRRHGRRLYPADSQADYKLKWGPDVIEREYVAARPLSLRAVVDLLRLTRSI